MLGAHLLTSEIQFGVCDGAAARRPTAAELRCKQEKENKYNQESFRKCFSIRNCKKMGFFKCVHTQADFSQNDFILHFYYFDAHFTSACSSFFQIYTSLI